ncbi:histidine kinase [Terrimonas sp. NA20]|uniref:Histidine kinase n=1 Tax=Terrimonas ginsenosidimutans TaxID=2908004 RepID=A0ABS9KR28_9BACT|nr:histidine kinase [Terrimonas ginsenosidimutans]MCG2614781.1 histidine kinase [Terrimonas ginsenosidimutans]
MNTPTIWEYALLVGSCILLALIGFYLLANFRKIFRQTIRIEWLRRNIVVWIVAACIILAATPMNGELVYAVKKHGWRYALMGELIVITTNTLIVFNLAWFVAEHRLFRRLSFARRQTLVLFTLILAFVGVNLLVRYLFTDEPYEYAGFSVVMSVYFACGTGFVYIMVSYLNLERQRKFDEKELELSRLRELKTKAELDALHSKVNPHFLYNALNSIADLSITDGKKARKMTVALADLFRYSINYSNNNYSSIREEVEMAEVYLQIEKIRFEDQLSYHINVDDAVMHYLVPRFVLQPLMENAVKHGLKATGKMTEIRLDIKLEQGILVIRINDNGPLFTSELSPGYGVRSVYDKLDLLFPGGYEIHFGNQPRKEVVIYIKKLMKNEPAI